MNTKDILEIYEIASDQMNKRDEAIWTQLTTRIDTINDRTKQHTLEIKQLRKEVKNGNRKSNSSTD